jgi:hypothetical protein
MKNLVSGVTVIALGLSAVTACNEEVAPTGPGQEEPNLAETASECGSVESEFTRSYEGDAEILLMTFEIDSEEVTCPLDMSSEGVTFGDTIFDEEWVMHQQYSYVQNLPSPERFAITLGTYQGTILFDPPIRRLSFFYNTAEDGLRVTTYNQYGWAIQRDSLEPTSNGDEWRSYTVTSSSSSDVISRVFLDYWTGNTGAFRLDDLEIKRSAPPSIACDTVVRGDVTTCEINRTVDSVLEWKFTGPLEHWLFAPDTVTVTDSTSSTTWTGTAVLSGDVSVRVTMEGGVDTVALTGKLAVEDRTWSWGDADWTWTDSTSTTLCEGYYGPFYGPGGARLAINRRTTDCSNRPLDIIQPSWPDSAYDDSKVQDGPNKGLWYVASADFLMDRTAEMNPFLRSNYSPRDQVTDKTDVRLCNKGAGTTLVNFWEYNELCAKNFSLDAFFEGMWDHEGMGSNGTTTDDQLANGHEARRWLAARDTANDPMRNVEDIVNPDSGHFAALIERVLDDADDEIFKVSRDHIYVKDNYLKKNGQCGTAWVYDTAQSQFTEIPMTRQDSVTGQIYCM